MAADKSISKKMYDAMVEEILNTIVTHKEDFDYLMNFAAAKRLEAEKKTNREQFDKLQTSQPCPLRSWDEVKGEKICKADQPRCATCAIYSKVTGLSLPKIEE